MNQNGFLKPRIKTSFDLIRSVSVRFNLMNTALIAINKILLHILAFMNDPVTYQNSMMYSGSLL